MELMNRQVLDLWNRYKPTIAVDAIEYDRELKKLLSTNLAEVGTDCISRRVALDALRKMQTYKMFSGDDMLLIDQAGAQTELMLLPPAEPKRGKWIDKGWTGDWQYLTDGRGDCWRNIVCSECGESVRHESNFCPNCGAKMEVNSESN